MYEKNGWVPPGPRIKKQSRCIRMIDSKKRRHVPAIEMEEVWAWRAFRNIIQTERKNQNSSAMGAAGGNMEGYGTSTEQLLLLEQEATNQSAETQILSKKERIDKRREDRERQNKLNMKGCVK